jgi:hypothetical protein
MVPETSGIKVTTFQIKPAVSIINLSVHSLSYPREYRYLKQRYLTVSKYCKSSPASIFLRPMVPETSGIFKVTTFQIKPAVPISESVGERFCVQFCVQDAPNMSLKQLLLRARGESQDTLSDFRVGPWAFGFRLVCRNAMFLS